MRTVQALNYEHLPVRFEIDFYAHIWPSPISKRNFENSQ